jgi:hypothetical protein
MPLFQESNMPWDLIIIGGLVLGAYLWSEAGNKRYIRDLLAERDQAWNEIINKHQKTIAEAYEKGEPVRFTIQG